MADRPPPTPPSPLTLSQLLLPLVICLCCCCLQQAAPLTDANWAPLRTHVVFNLTNITDEEAYVLRETINVAAARMESVLKALDLNPGRDLRLNRSRSYCATWVDLDRCGVPNQTYMTTGERCSNDPTFIIPEEYLSEMAVYNSSSASKLVVKAAGPGVRNANFILFVTTQQSSSCRTIWQERPISSTTCSQQWTIRRPLAGLLRVCPQSVSSELASRTGRLLQHVLAGLVRLLGFSGPLMSDFQRLPRLGSIEDTWETLSESDLITWQAGLGFVQTPAVRSFAERHFNCSIGVPLAASVNAVTAWDPSFMLPSVLSAVSISPGATGLDEGTLALLVDSGWYQANYSLSDPIVWGRQAGCWFSQRCAAPPGDPEPTFCSDAGSAALRSDQSHRSEGRCAHINGTNCSAVLPMDERLCTQPGNWRRLQLHGPASNWTECLPIDCLNGSVAYALTRNGSRIVCTGGVSGVPLGGDVRLVCAHFSLVCPRLSSVLDLLSGFAWQQSDVNGSNGTTTSPKASTVSDSSGVHLDISSTSAISSNSNDINAGTGTSGSIVNITATSNKASTSTSVASTSARTETAATTSPSSPVPSIKTTPNPPAKFSIRFATMDYFDLVSKDQVPAFKSALQKSLAVAFSVSIELISIFDVKPGSVISIWENSDPSTDAASKLERIKSLIKDGRISVTIGEQTFPATSVETYTDHDNSWTFPLMEVIIGSVVGFLLLTGFILVIALVTMKHKLNRPRMQVRPRSVDTSPATSSQASRQCSAAPSGVVQLAVLGGAGIAPTARAVADVESTHGGRRNNRGCRGGRGGGGGQERDTSAGSVGLQFSNSALYFDA